MFGKKKLKKKENLTYYLLRVKCWLNKNRTVLLPVQNESLIKENKLNF